MPPSSIVISIGRFNLQYFYMVQINRKMVFNFVARNHDR